MCRRGEHGSGEESCVAGGKGFALPICKPPPLVAVLGRPGGGGGGHFRRILQGIRPPPGCIPLHIVLICKQMLQFLQVLFHFPPFAPGFGEILRLWLFWSGPAAVCRMVGAWSRGTRRRCRSPSVNCSARNIGRRATLLPSPLRRSFLPVSASRWWSLLCSAVLLLWAFCWGLWRSFLLRRGGYIRGYILSLFNRARNKRARTRKGWRCSFLLLCPLRGCWRRFSLWVGVGVFPRRSESVAGRFCPFSIFPGALSKIYTGIKLAPLGRFLVRPGGAGLASSVVCALLGASVVSPGRCSAARGSGPAWRTGGGKWWTGQPSARRLSRP